MATRTFVGDFETTVFKGQEFTEVWASACVELNSEDVKIFQSIGEQFDYFRSLDCNLIVYYHNLKFDGSFWLSYFLTELKFEQAVERLSDTKIEFLKRREMRNNTFSYSISDRGQWYRMTVRVGGHYIEFRDSLKLLPFSVKAIGKSFGTKHKKLDMEYKGFRYAGCEITPDERKYIANDVLVVKEALEIMFKEGHNKLTIGSCCLAEYKRLLGKRYDELFPNLYEIPIEPCYEALTAGDYIRRSYRGGWCYVAKGKEKKIWHNGCTADVNSLYPSMMSSESGNFYPVGTPTFWKGDFIPMEALTLNRYYFVRVKTRFYLKPGKLPFIQIKNTLMYGIHEMLETSDMKGDDGKYYPVYQESDGTYHECFVTMTMTMTDFKLFKEHYDLVDFEILDGCWFNSAIGIFDSYIEKYKQLKLNSTGAMRTLAKLFLNNLYGKMASSTNSDFNIAYLKEDGTVGFYTQTANDKKPGYIAVGSAITSYARNFTIRAAQMNYHGVDEDGFIYADTDSIHCSLTPAQVKGIKVHPKDFCCWKLESTWDIGLFVRQKTYVEHIVEEDCEPIEEPYYNVKCAGMPEKCKELFVKSMQGFDFEKEKADAISNGKPEPVYSEDELDFLSTKRTLNDFTIGLCVPGKLMPRRIRGGVLLVDTTYQMR